MIGTGLGIRIGTHNRHPVVFAALCCALAISVSGVACVAGDDSTPSPSPKDSGTSGADSGTGTFDTSSPGFDTSSPGFDTNPEPPTDTGVVGTDTTPPPTDTGGPCTTSLIDDMETAGGIKKACGRMGFWYTYNDATVGGTQSPLAGSAFAYEAIPGGRGASTHASHTTGSGFTTWGAGMAFDLNNPGGTAPKGPYAACAYSGITFFAKAATALTVRVNFSTPPTEPGVGGTCTGAKCSDHFGKSVGFATDWSPVTITFAELAQLGWGTPATFDKCKLIAVQFQVDKSTPFDVWVDDVSFTP